jgi:hypothetical protein
VKTDIVDVAAHAQAHERFVLLVPAPVPVDRKRSEGLSCEFCCDDVLAVNTTSPFHIPPAYVRGRPHTPAVQ